MLHMLAHVTGCIPRVRMRLACDRSSKFDIPLAAPLFAECVALPAACELWEPIYGSRSRLCVPKATGLCRELLPGESRQVVYWLAPFARHNDRTERMHSWRPRTLSAAEVCRLRCHWRNMRGLELGFRLLWDWRLFSVPGLGLSPGQTIMKTQRQLI